jgi:hypothetical protein
VLVTAEPRLRGLKGSQLLASVAAGKRYVNSQLVLPHRRAAGVMVFQEGSSLSFTIIGQLRSRRRLCKLYIVNMLLLHHHL